MHTPSKYSKSRLESLTPLTAPDLRELRNVVDEYRHRRGLGDPPVKGEHARLIHRVVERRCHEHGIRAQSRRRFDLRPDRCHAGLRHTADHGYASGARLNHGAQDPAAGGFIQRRSFTGRSQREEAVNPTREHVFHEAGD